MKRSRSRCEWNCDKPYLYYSSSLSAKFTASSKKSPKSSAMISYAHYPRSSPKSISDRSILLQILESGVQNPALTSRVSAIGTTRRHLSDTGVSTFAHKKGRKSNSNDLLSLVMPSDLSLQDAGFAPTEKRVL